jgi:hypothetical protein
MMAPTWTTTKTVSLWVKPEGPGEVCSLGVEVAACDAIFGDRPRFWGIARGVLGGQDRIWVFNFDGSSDMVGVDYIPGEWVHIALVHDGGVLRAYKNGFEVGSVPSGPTQQPPVTAPRPVLQLGGVIMSPRNWTFGGWIDEVQIWNVARSAAEIRQDMNSILLGDEIGLAAYYRMSDGAGLTLTDDSINNWNGVLHDGGDGVPPDGAPPQWVLSDAFPSIIAANDAATTAEDAAVVVPVLANDRDLDGDALTVTAAGPAAHGTVTINPGGAAVTYTPEVNFYGADTFLYTVSNSRGRTAMAQVDITVTPVNDTLYLPFLIK